MNVAITDWDGRVSPVFDCASRLLIAQIKDGVVLSKRYERFNPDQPVVMAKQLVELGVEVLICGAVSRSLSLVVEQIGVDLIPFIGGEVESVLAAYAKEGRVQPDFLMPGCGRGWQGKKKRASRGGCAGIVGNKGVSKMPRRDGTGPEGQGPGTGRGAGRCVGVNNNGAGTGRRGRGKGAGLGAGCRGQGRGRRK